MNRSWLKPRANDLAALAVLLALIALTLWIRLWRQPGLDDWDVMTFYLPGYAFLGEHIRHFTVPGWNPHLFSGTPFAANPQLGWSYLPAMGMFALFSPTTAFKLLIAFELALGGVTTYMFARILKIGTIGSLAAAIVFSFGQNLGASTCCSNHLQLEAWIPLALIGVELSLRSANARNQAFWLAVSAVAISQIIAGWVGQGTYYAMLLISAYLIFRAVQTAKPWRMRVVAMAVDGCSIVLGGIALSAAGLLPRLEFASRTYVGTTAYQSEIIKPNKDWHWWLLLQTLVSYQPQWRPYYQGAAVLTCVAIAFVTLSKSRLTVFFAIFSAVVIILPMKPTPVHRLFYLLPRFRVLHLHDPGRTLAILPIGIALLTAIGVEALPRLSRYRRGYLLGLAPVALWIILLAIRPSDMDRITGTTWAVFGMAVLLLTLAGIWNSGRFQPGFVRSERAVLVAQTGLLVLLFLDPTGAALVKAVTRSNYVEATYAHVSSSAVVKTQTAADDPSGAGEFLQALRAKGETFRYFGFVSPPAGNGDWQLHEHYMEPDVLPLLANNRAWPLGLDDIQGYDPAHLTIYRDFFIKLNAFERDYHEELVYASGLDSPLLNLLNVRYVVVPLTFAIDPVRYREVFRNDQVRVLENLQALPRAWIVHSAQQSAPDATLDLLAAGTVDPRTTALLDKTPPALAPTATTANESAAITEFADDSIKLSVHADSAGLMMLSEIYDPGWNVSVDGKKATIYRADSVLRAVAVTAGDHTIEFRYEPRSLRIGIIVSSIAALLVFGIAVWAALGWLGDAARSRKGSNRDIDGAFI